MAIKKFSPKKQITKSNTEKLSKKSAGVYKITDSAGEMLYVGKAKAGGFRGVEKVSFE